MQPVCIVSKTLHYEQQGLACIQITLWVNLPNERNL
jgi:hypothetical protein